jgi:Mobilization protein NikA
MTAEDRMEKDEHTGRSGSETRRRSSIIGFRATDAERAEIEAAAERSGLTVSSYARATMLSAPQTRITRRPSIEREALAQLLAQLGRIGGNVHQISKALNFREPVMADIPSVLAEVKAAGAAIMNALGREHHDH